MFVQKKNIFILIYIFFIKFFFDNNLLSQNKDPVILEPSKVINRQVILKLENDLKSNNPDIATIIKAASSELQKYYSQFIENKTILYEKQTKDYDQKFYDKNTLRLIGQNLLNQKSTPYFLGAKPYLHRLHLILARAYASPNQPQIETTKAIQEYKTALRYSLIQPQSISKNLKKKLSEVNEDNYKFFEELKINYNWMLLDLNTQEKYNEENDNNVNRLADNFKKEYYNFLKLENDYKKLVDNLTLAKYNNSKKSEIESSQKNKNNKLNEIKKTIDNLENIRLNDYKKYIENYNQNLANTVYELALLTKQIELENKYVLSKSKEKTFLKGKGDADFNLNFDIEKQNISYTILLEFANKINPNEKIYLKELANEYRKGKKTTEAIYYLNSYISKIKSEEKLKIENPKNDIKAINKNFQKNKTIFTNQNPKNKKELASSYLRLAGLYTTEKKQFQAEKSYEEYLKLEKTNNAILGLANLCLEKTGNTERALELFLELLEKKSKLDNVLIYDILQKVSRIYNLKQEKENEKKYLNNAISVYKNLNTELAKLENELIDLQKQVNVLKKELRNTNDEDKQKKYFVLSGIKLSDKKIQKESLEAKMRALNHPKILERLAFLYQLESNWSQAINLYNNIISFGSTEQVNRARQNLEGIQSRLTNGTNHKPVLSPDFDR